jgi:hypothetical protein
VAIALIALSGFVRRRRNWIRHRTRRSGNPAVRSREL